MYLTMTALTLSVVAEEPDYLWRQCNDHSDDDNFYNSGLQVPNVFEDNTIKMSEYAGQVLLVVNVASY